LSSLNGDAVIVTIDTDGRLWLGGHPPPGGAHTEGRGGQGSAEFAAYASEPKILLRIISIIVVLFRK